LLNALRTDFQADIREGRQDPSGQLLHAWGKLQIGDNEISFEADFSPDGAAQVCPVILLHSEAYESVYDVLHQVVDPRSRQALVEFCLAIAASIESEGFILEFASDEKLSSLLTQKLVARLMSDQPDVLVAGLAVAAPLVTEVRRMWPLAPERKGYVTFEFI
jgi:hypothetical protein